MKKLQIINTFLLLSVILYLIVSTFNKKDTVKEAYIVTGELYEGFDYQKELNVEYLSLEEKKNKEIESFIESIKEKEDKLKGKKITEEEYTDFQVNLNRLNNFQNEVEAELTKTKGLYNVKIWKKLNTYVGEFGKKNNYKVIFGAGGDGNIMYAKEVLDITEEVIDYCNQKFNGK